MSIKHRASVALAVVLLSCLLMYCNPVRQFADAPAAGGTSAEAGSSAALPSGGASSSIAGQFAEGGQADESEAEGGNAGSGGAGGDAATSEGGASEADAGAAGSAGVSGECGPHVPCSEAGRPFCNALHECVGCLQDTDCPTPSGQCVARSCDQGECKEVPKPNTTPCDDGVYCNGSDQCDATGHCAAHANDMCSGKVCHEDTKSCTCNTAPSVSGYCGTADEATDRAAVDAAKTACAGCAGGCTACVNYTRVNNGNCTEFHCLP